MPNRTAKFVSAVVAGFLAGACLTTVSSSAAPAPDDCLSAPKEQTPQGSHWFYRIDRATKRHCWYLGEARAKPSQSATNSSPSSKPTVPKAETAAPRSIADAHAELPLPQTRVEQETSVADAQALPATTANTANMDNSQRANAGGASTQLSVIASRWPQSDLNSSDSPGPGPEPTTATSDQNVQSYSEAAPAPVVAAVPLAAADSSSESQVGSMQMLLLVIAGALALAGITGATVFRFGNIRQIGRREIRSDRRAIWDSVDPHRSSPAAHPRKKLPMRKVDLPRELREADDPNGRIEEMLARLHRRVAN